MTPRVVSAKRSSPKAGIMRSLSKRRSRFDNSVSKVGDYPDRTTINASPLRCNSRLLTSVQSSRDGQMSVRNSSRFDKLKLPDFLRVGLLKLIPKGVEKDRRVIGNWRPLVMQESIYKLFSGAFTKRMNKALQLIINPNQNGFIPQRCLNENVRLIESILDYGNKNNRGGGDYPN